MDKDILQHRLKELQEELKMLKQQLMVEMCDSENYNRLREKIAFNHGQITMLREFI